MRELIIGSPLELELVRVVRQLAILLGGFFLSGCIVPLAAGVLIGTAVVAAPPADNQQAKAPPPVAPLAGSPGAVQSYSTLDDSN